MHDEQTSILYNVKYLPDQVMSHDEYVARRDTAVARMVGDRLATKGTLCVKRTITRMEMFQERGIPDHMRNEVMMRQFERQARSQFEGQFDRQCFDCGNCKVDVRISLNGMTGDTELTALCFCEATKKGGLTCFDGYLPLTQQWEWPPYQPVAAEFKVGEPNPQGLVFTTLHFSHSELTMNMDERFGGFHTLSYNNAHDEPPGLMTRNNADAEYMTKAEMKLANEALARVSKMVRATLPTPRPQTPTEDAW